VESKKCKAVEREEAAQQMALEQEESQRIKNQRAAECAESQACKAAEMEAKAVDLVAAKAAEAADKARRATEKLQFTQTRNL
jgi:hypothetical protein